MKNFNVRVYGILLNEKQEVLVSDERAYGMDFTKFPGGGLEYGEGLADALRREFMEECGVSITIVRHVFTTDHFQQSAFDNSQIIAVYYLVEANGSLNHLHTGTHPFDFGGRRPADQVFRWVSSRQLQTADLTFDTDKFAWQAFRAQP